MVMTVTLITPDPGEQQNEFNIDKFEQLNTYTVRDLDCGLTARVHPEADEISRLTHQWLRDHEMHTIFDEKTFQRFLNMDCPRLLCMTHPDSPFDGTLWMAKLVTTFFLADDFLETQCGEFAPVTPNHLLIEWNLVMFWSFPSDSEKMISDLLEIFVDYPEYRKIIEDVCQSVVAEAANHPFGTAYPEKVSPCASGFRDLWQQAITVMPKDWSLRLAKFCSHYFCWHIRESFSCKQKKIPTIEEYKIHRNGTGGMHILLGPAPDYVDRNLFIAPDEVYYSPRVQHLLNATNLTLCLNNDVYSFPKELRNGEYHNMVFLVSYWESRSYNEAVEVVLGMVEDLNRDIVATCKKIASTVTPEHRLALQPTIAACLNAVAAHNAFHKTSYRYDFNKPLVVVVS